MTAPAQMPSEPNIPSLERSRPLRLAFECLQTLPEGSNPVRVWWDENLQCEQVGKRVDLSNLDDVLPEPAILRQIRHDHVVPILAAPVVDGFPQPMRVIEIVTPYYKRGSLTDAFIRGERFGPTETVRIVQAALRGLGHLHEVHGILHRDIKSPNILLTEDEFLARVGDLGCAGRIGEDGRTPALDIPPCTARPNWSEQAFLPGQATCIRWGSCCSSCSKADSTMTRTLSLTSCVVCCEASLRCRWPSVATPSGHRDHCVES